MLSDAVSEEFCDWFWVEMFCSCCNFVRGVLKEAEASWNAAEEVRECGAEYSEEANEFVRLSLGDATPVIFELEYDEDKEVCEDDEDDESCSDEGENADGFIVGEDWSEVMFFCAGGEEVALDSAEAKAAAAGERPEWFDNSLFAGVDVPEELAV